MKNYEDHLTSKGLNNRQGENQTNSSPGHQEMLIIFLDNATGSFAIGSTKGQESTRVVWFQLCARI